MPLAIIALVALLVLCFALGWPAERMARDPSPRGGLGCAGLAIGAPALAWVAIGLVLWGTGSDPGITPYVVLGFIISVGAIVAGMSCAKAIRAWQKR